MTVRASDVAPCCARISANCRLRRTIWFLSVGMGGKELSRRRRGFTLLADVFLRGLPPALTRFVTSSPMHKD